MWPNPQEIADLVTFTEEILNGNFLDISSVIWTFGNFLDINILITKGSILYVKSFLFKCHPLIDPMTTCNILATTMPLVQREVDILGNFQKFFLRKICGVH